MSWADMDIIDVKNIIINADIPIFELLALLQECGAPAYTDALDFVLMNQIDEGVA